MMKSKWLRRSEKTRQEPYPGMTGPSQSGSGRNPFPRFSIGPKLMLGAGLISTFCIGILVVYHWQMSNEFRQETDSLLRLSFVLNQELRSRISELQETYLNIPSRLRADPAERFFSWIKENHGVEETRIFEGRESYGKFFDRKHRRDILKGGFVVAVEEGRLVVSRGLQDGQGNFTDQVERFYLQSDAPESDAKKILEKKVLFANSHENGQALVEKVSLLNAEMADAAIEAEQARIKILDHVEEITRGKESLDRISRERKRYTALIAACSVMANLLALYLLTWFKVGKPLKTLTRCIRQINGGQTIPIPFKTWKDEIGILAAALEDFQTALSDISRTDQQKQEKSQVVQALVHTLSGTIENLKGNADVMKAAAVQLDDLAGTTGDQADDARNSAQNTMERTDSVSQAARDLESAVGKITCLVKAQNDLVKDIHSAALNSAGNIKDLTEAGRAIDEITEIVNRISGRIKLLALNAKIEAARAGQAGKGFAVVADEVRDLSIRTEAASREISQKAGGIQTVSSSLVTNNTRIENQVKTLLSVSRDIRTAVGEQAAWTETIANKAGETSTEIHNVTDRIARVGTAAAKTRVLSQGVRNHCVSMAEDLTGLLEEARLKLSRISSFQDPVGKTEYPGPGLSVPEGTGPVWRENLS